MGFDTQANPRGAQAINVSIAVGVIAPVAVLLRIVARSRSKAPLAIDDWLIVASLLPLFAMISASILSQFTGESPGCVVKQLTFPSGYSRRTGEIDPHSRAIRDDHAAQGLIASARIQSLTADNAQTLMATMLTYSAAATTVKLSILSLYRRLFITRTLKSVTLFVGALCMLWFIVGNLADVFQCHPIGAAFDARLVFTHQCINLQTLYWGIISTNMVRSFRIWPIMLWFCARALV